MIAIRSTNVFLLVALCVAYLACKRRSLTRWDLVRAATAALGAAAAMGVQVAYNYYVHRAFMLNSYGAERFLFDRPMQAEVLLSYERGLLTYQPLYALALLCGLCVTVARGWAYLLLATIAAYVTLYGYWHSWMLGGGMGHRGFVELAPIVCIAMGIAMQSFKTEALVAVVVAGTLCAMVTLSVMIGYWAGTYPFGGADSHVYWTHVIGFDPDEPPPPPPPKPKKKAKRRAS